MTICLLFALAGNTVRADNSQPAEEQWQAESVSSGDNPADALTTPAPLQFQPDYVLGREMTEEEKRQQIEIFDRYAAQGAYREMEGDGADLRTGENVDWLPYVSLPSAYDSRDVNGACYITPVRNQNPYGTCWAFSALACIEANMVKNGYAGLDVDLSERHLAYFSNTSVPDKLGNGGRDQSCYRGTDLYQAGGNTMMAYRALAAWKGAVTEELCPYEGIPAEPDRSVEAVYDNAYARLTGYYRIASSDMNAVKGTIMEYGAVSVSYYAYSGNLNPSTAAYYCDTANPTNHAVTIIGWDDSYSRDNFNTRPVGDGAWLAKNSWGTAFGDQGFFWISYEDKSISKEACAYEAEPAGRTDNNYQYDTATGGLRMGSVGGRDFAVVYTVKGNPDRAERLSAVSVELSSPTEVTYSLQVYNNLRYADDPTSGDAMLSVPQTGILKYAGYHTIPLEETVMLDQGDLFSVVLTLTGDGENYVYVALETDYDGDYYSDATAEGGQNFVRGGSSGWTDSGLTRDANLRFKVFTEDMETPSVPCKGVSIDRETAELYTGDCLQLSAKVLPAQASNPACLWTGSDSRIVRVGEDGLVEAVGAGTATVTVTALNGRFTAACEVTVQDRVPVQSILLDTEELKLGIGNKTRLTAAVVPEDATDARVVWRSSDESVVTVDDTGLVCALREGRADIEVLARDGSGVTAVCPVTVYFVRPPAFRVRGVIGGRQVTFESATAGAVIYYSTDHSALTLEDPQVHNGDSVIFEDFYGTVYARAYYDGVWSNVSRLILKIPVVNTPQITHRDGIVSIRTTTPDSTIYYTTDGSVPSPENGTRLTHSAGSFTVTSNCTVKAIAVRSCFTNSQVASAPVAARRPGPPSFAVRGVIGGREVTFNTTEPQGEIYYSLTTSGLTTGDMHVRAGETVLFRSYYGTVYARTYVNGAWSNVSRLILRIPAVSQPTITALGGGRVRIATGTPDCAIYYTTDGSTPTPANGRRIGSSGGIVTVERGCTVRAIAVRSCFTNSEVASGKVY